jgi:GNAT superfamily N-acetyltransferase
MSDMNDAAVPQEIPVTVTFLEMDAPPARYTPLPYNRNVALLKIRNVPRHYYRYLLDRVGRHWHWVNALRLSDEELEKGLAMPGRDIRVLHVDGVPSGFFDLKPDLPDAVEIAYFGMMPHVTGSGLGRWFLSAAIEAAWAQEPRRVTVQTCTLDHPAALPLYQKLGFSPVDQAQEIVTPLTMTERAAIVMRD